jgi:hypothetical protein
MSWASNSFSAVQRTDAEPLYLAAALDNNCPQNLSPMDALILDCGRPQMAAWRRNHDITGPARQARLYVEDAASSLRLCHISGSGWKGHGKDGPRRTVAHLSTKPPVSTRLAS